MSRLRQAAARDSGELAADAATVADLETALAAQSSALATLRAESGERIAGLERELELARGAAADGNAEAGADQAELTRRVRAMLADAVAVGAAQAELGALIDRLTDERVGIDDTAAASLSAVPPFAIGYTAWDEAGAGSANNKGEGGA